MGKLDGKVAIITGATSGMGRESAYLFSKEGAKVAVVGRNEERGKEVVKNITDAGREAIFIQADMSNIDSVDKVISTTIEKFDKIDILYSNAGVIRNTPFEDITQEEYDLIMDTNLRVPFVLAQKAVPYLLESKGCILFTSSASAHKPSTDSYIYNTSKTALLMLSKAIAIAYADKGIRVNTLSPGLIDTGILEGIPEDIVEAYALAQPMKRMGTPYEIAKAALFMVSEDASLVTGIDILVDGAGILKP